MSRPNTRFATTLLLAVVWSCSSVLGEYEVDDGTTGSSSSGGGGGPECTVEADCGDGRTCFNQRCFDKCSATEPCVDPWVTCGGHMCGDAPGAPCDDSMDCVHLDYCLRYDNFDREVPGYCSDYCWDRACPPGFECIHDRCWQISDGQLWCYYPDTNAPCGYCVQANCASELEDCCDSEPTCDTVTNQIIQCDSLRTWDACNGLYEYDPSYSTAYDSLRACITADCEGACYNPCPGSACR